MEARSIALPGRPVDRLALRTWAVALARTALLAGVCVAAGKAAFALAFVHTSIAPAWPSSGIALAAVLLWGRRAVPGGAAGAFLFNASTPVPLWVSAVEGRERLRAPGSAERFGSDALAETVADDRGLDAMLDGLLTAVRQANGGELSDDVAILCVAGSTKPLGVHGRAL